MPATIRLRTRQFRKYASLKGWTSDDAIAKALAMNPATISRVLRGLTAPGERFIAATLTAFPELDFADLFDVLIDDQDDAA